VVPNAAYRHFASRGALLQAVRSSALAALAMAMEKELTRQRRGKRGADAARAGLRAIGTAYLRFARTEPGLFRAAFAVPGEPETTNNPAMAGRSGLNPYQLLGAALDEMVKAGLLPPERRPGAEYLAWSAVHGIAMLVLEGPLWRLTSAEARQIGQRVIDMVEQGL
jgi:AcrR family transcriptional regulator